MKFFFAVIIARPYSHQSAGVLAGVKGDIAFCFDIGSG